MTTRRDRRGGMPARRAVTRWAWRLLRRDWRQHVLIVSLLTVTVAAAVGFMCATYNIAPTSGQAEFGDADHWFQFDDPDPATLPAKLDAARQWFGAVDPIGHRSVTVPGTTKSVDYRAQEPNGPFSAPLLDLRAGRYPADDTESAVTDWVAGTVGAGIGSTIALDGVARTVVGIVENPSKLSDEFVLLAPSALAQSSSVTMLVKASDGLVDSFRPPGDAGRIISSRGDFSAEAVAAVLTLVVTTLVMFLVALIAAASFTVIAQRRLPQLGMMAAVGATERHLRQSMLASGASTGLVAAVLGAVLGTGGWLALAPHMEATVDARIDAWNVPWLLVVAGMALAFAAATGAAWWPGRTMSHIPPVFALSGRPPRPRALDRSALLAAGCVAGGMVCLALGSDFSRHPSGVDFALLAIGTIALLTGVLLSSPLAVRALARAASRAPIAARLALRDLGRHQARSGAALAAISLSLGIPVVVVASAAAAENGKGMGNLASNQLLVRAERIDGPFVPDAGTVADRRTGVDEITAALDTATNLELDAAWGGVPIGKTGVPGRPGVALVRPTDGGWASVALVYVASPELLAEYGLTADDLASDTVIFTAENGDLRVIAEPMKNRDGGDPTEDVGAFGRLPDTYSSLPQALITPDQVAARGWEAVPSGRWLIETERPLSSHDRSVARGIAARHGLTIETRDDLKGLADLRNGAVAVGMLLALGVLAMTVGLIRAESAGDLRTLTATGATRSTRRTITATTAAGLATLGAVLGVPAAYLALVAARLHHLTPLPLTDLALIAAGTPFVAGAVGWLVAGREPALLARRPME